MSSHTIPAIKLQRMNSRGEQGDGGGDDGEEEDEFVPFDGDEEPLLVEQDWPKHRTLLVHAPQPGPPNVVSNAKYNVATFFPLVLYGQFKFFFNLYFLLVGLSQIVPALRIGYLSAYIVPLVFVLTITIGKEALDDMARRRRDAEANRETLQVLQPGDEERGLWRETRASLLRAGHVVRLWRAQRVPADLVLLQAEGKECFLRTDMLDGETDWKLRIPCSLTADTPLHSLQGGKLSYPLPQKSLTDFGAMFELGGHRAGLTLDNSAWTNCVVASEWIIGVVMYTGTETRPAQNTALPTSKVSLLDLEINKLSKALCLLTFLLSVMLVALGRFEGSWWISIFRFLILFSTIIPISLRVNLDLGKSWYARQIEHDPDIPNTIVRTGNIPEDLGRISYLLTDKTGTLTQNDMTMRKIHIGTVSYSTETFHEIRDAMDRPGEGVNKRLQDIAWCLACCHSVTPHFEEGSVEYQAASPDEIAIVRFVASVGLNLLHRDRTSLTLEQEGREHVFQIIKIFPFTSELKRMGIIIRHEDDVWFYVKGADVVMTSIAASNDWLDEEVSNMAREGLRTLVVARKKLSIEVLEKFLMRYDEASVSLHNRDTQMGRVVTEMLETDCELLGVTGVEDKLARDVKSNLEILRNAGIKVWMVTGDKPETARCIGVSSKLITRNQYVLEMTGIKSALAAREALQILQRRSDACLLVDGESLGMLLAECSDEFINAATRLPCVIACRLSPLQKSMLVTRIAKSTGLRVAAIGDGGNDVSMITASHIGVGIVGKEGRQASLAADISVEGFYALNRLILWHGRNSWKRSSRLAMLIIHRGLLVSFSQIVYSVVRKYEPIALFQGFLMVGYATVYTMCPIFSLVLDYDISCYTAMQYPELYKYLKASLSYKMFGWWCAVSFFQGTIIQALSMILEHDDRQMVAVSFTSCVVCVLGVVCGEIGHWHKIIALVVLLSLCGYFASLPLLYDYFDTPYLKTPAYWWKWIAVASIAITPPLFIKQVRRRIKPPAHAKVQNSI